MTKTVRLTAVLFLLLCTLVVHKTAIIIRFLPLKYDLSTPTRGVPSLVIKGNIVLQPCELHCGGPQETHIWLIGTSHPWCYYTSGVFKISCYTSGVFISAHESMHPKSPLDDCMFPTHGVRINDPWCAVRWGSSDGMDFEGMTLGGLTPWTSWITLR